MDLEGSKRDVFFNASFDILRGLLEEESSVLAQLTYVVERIHRPIVERCSKPQPRDNESKEKHILTFTQHWEIFANIATLHEIQSIVIRRFEKAVKYGAQYLVQEKEGTSEKRDSKTVLQSIPELFSSSAMRHYVAEHMTYTQNYCRNIAPRIMALWRLWRRCPGGFSGDSLTKEEYQQLKHYQPFLWFLWVTLGGERGVPDDVRVVTTRLPETFHVPLLSHESLKGTTSGTKGSVHKHQPRVTSSTALELPPIPLDWQGFETILVLLSTPLSSLRRYIHVARCLIESRCLEKSVRRYLQTEFVNFVARQLAVESSIVLYELGKQNVANIMSLIDEVVSTGESGSNVKKCHCVHPDIKGNRTLVHYGRLIKRFRRGRHERLMFLFSDWLCYVEELVNGRMRLRASISLEALKVVELKDSTELPYGFDIVTSETRITFFAPTREQQQQWIGALLYTARAYEKEKAAQSRVRQTGEMEYEIRPTMMPLSRHSRLRLQQRDDKLYQERIERDAVAAAVGTKTATLVSAPAPPVSTESAEQAYSWSRRPKRSSFDLTHWANQSARIAPRRARSVIVLPALWSPSAHAESVFGNDNHSFAPDTPAASDLVVDHSGHETSASRIPRRPSQTLMGRLLSERFQDSPFAPSSANNRPPISNELSPEVKRETETEVLSPNASSSSNIYRE